MSKKKKWSLVAFTSLFLVTVVLIHLPVSNLMSKPIPTILGTLIIRDWSLPAGILILIIALLFLWRKYKHGARKILTIVIWVFTILYLLVLYKYFLIHPVEFAHFVQYGFPAWLVAYINDPEKRKFDIGTPLLIISGVGIFDECFQYFYTCPAYNNYLDITDMLLNVVAAGIGVLFYYSFSALNQGTEKFPRQFYKLKSFRIIMLVLIIIFIGWSSGRLHFKTTEKIPSGGIIDRNGYTEIFLEREPGIYGSFRIFRSFKTGEFYVTPPFSGTVLIFLTYFFFSMYDPRFIRYFGIRLQE